MQAQEGFKGSNDLRALIMKGKRTKRPRSSSSSRFGLPMTSSSSSGGGGGVAEEYNSICSSTTSGDIYESTEEEEMANCLIMLAQSDGPKRSVEAKLKIATMTNKAEFYVYECKVCNRSFPSFQALGGHKASHKKTKIAINAEHKKPLVVTVNETVIALRSVSSKKGNNKIHECSICGSEFTSGQALGGHMRRHRAAASNESDPISISTASNSNKLLLDLNLPAPEDYDHRDSQFQFGSPQQAIVFSTPALVDCHY